MGMRIRDGTSLLKQVHQHRANIERAATDNDIATEKITRDYAGHSEGHNILV